jgi:FkbM family methyltransferase
MTLTERTLGSRRWSALRRVLPYRVGFAIEAAVAAEDVASLRRLMALRRPGPVADPRRVVVRSRLLSGAPVELRTGSTDVWAFLGLLPPYDRAHVPEPAVLPRDAACVWDLGANIGVTMAHLAVALPEARIVGVELDPENAAQARTNTATWADRCEVLEGAVWPSPGELVYAAPAGAEVGFHASEAGAPEAADRAAEGPLHRAAAIPLADLARTYAGPDGRIAFVKMDIEGAERTVLADGDGWADRVDAISVEIHPPYDVASCRRDLQALGFEIRGALDGDGDSRPALIARRPRPAVGDVPHPAAGRGSSAAPAPEAL